MSGETRHPVGYCSPPVHSRFRKGTSGNPKGRPKKPDDLYTLLNRALNRKVTVQGIDKKIPIREALVRKLRELALSGDRRALKLQRRILDDAGHNETDRDDREEAARKLQAAAEKLGFDKVKAND